MSMATRPTADELVDAVRNAGANLAALDDRIDELERDLIAARMAADNASSDLAEARRALEVSGLALQDEAKRRDRAENTAAYHVRRTGNLQSELESTLGDLTRVTEAIAGALGLAEHE